MNNACSVVLLIESVLHLQNVPLLLSRMMMTFINNEYQDWQDHFYSWQCPIMMSPVSLHLSSVKLASAIFSLPIQTYIGQESHLHFQCYTAVEFCAGSLQYISL